MKIQISDLNLSISILALHITITAVLPVNFSFSLSAEPLLTFCYDDFPNGSFTLTGLSISTTYYIRVASYLPTTQFIDFNICVKTPNTCNLIVLSIEDEGSYSLRNIINCASNNDIILFDTYLSGTAIALDIPTIDINKILILDATTLSENLILCNKEINNRDVLLDIQNQLTIRGIEIHGLSSESMIVKISAGGELRVQ